MSPKFLSALVLFVTIAGVVSAENFVPTSMDVTTTYQGYGWWLWSDVVAVDNLALQTDYVITATNITNVNYVQFNSQSAWVPLSFNSDEDDDLTFYVSVTKDDDDPGAFYLSLTQGGVNKATQFWAVDD